MHTKIFLPESELPTHWYNVLADMPNKPAPYLGPDGKPVTPDAMMRIFPESLVMQEMMTDRWVPIPEPVRDVLALWRPSPLYRAHRLEAALGTPAKIFYKNESVSPAGSHKPNTAVAQAYYNKEAGINRLTTETGAGQWGCSLALAGQMFGMEVRVYMVKVSYEQKPYRRSMMQTWGAEVFPSPTNMTEAGRQILAAHPDSPGSLGIAISEAVEEAASRNDTNYALGSVLNHVCLHQTIVGQEAQKQLAMVGEYPDVVIACCGGGSNFAGIAFPFFADKAAGKEHHAGGGRAGLLPDAHQGRVRLRLGRRRRPHAADEDVHAGPRLRAAGHPRGRAALPRRLGAGQPAEARRADRRGRRSRSSRPSRQA